MKDKGAFGCMEKEYKIAVTVTLVSFFTFLTVQAFATTANTDRIANLEKKIDKIYDYIIQKEGK